MQPALQAAPASPARCTFVCALPLYHIFALTVCCAAGDAHRRTERADPQPARHRRHASRICRSTASTCSRRSTRCSTRCATTRTSRKLDFSATAASRTAAAWPCRRRSPTNGWRRPAARSSKATACPRPRRAPPAIRPTTQRLHRHDRPAAAVNARSASSTMTASDVPLGQPGEICHPRAAGDGRLLAAARRDGHGR